MLFPVLLALHIASGFVSLVSALIAMASRKRGAGLHTRAGTWFAWGMTAMALSAGMLTWWEPDLLSLGAALWTLHLVHTARSAAAQRDGGLDRPARLALVPGAAALGAFLFGLVSASAGPGEYQGSGTAGYAVFGAFAGLSLAFDLGLARRGALPARARIARHAWRMTTACFLAVTSLFLGQQDDVFPFMAGSPVLLLPSLLTVAFLLFWMLRIRFARNWLGPVVAWRQSAQPSSLEKDIA